MKLFPWALLLIGLLLTSFSYDKLESTRYLISDQSTLELQGSSNVAKFKCHCQCSDSFGQGSLDFQYADNGYKVRLSRSSMTLKAKLLDCGHRGINKDMYATLKADEHPEINIIFKEVFLPEGKATLEDCVDWKKLQATAEIEIAGVRRPAKMEIKAKRISDNYFQFMATHQLLLSDFSLTPPAPMLGLIKVSDEIVIDLDLHVKII